MKNTYLILLLLLLTSCEKILMTDDVPATSVGTFEYLWDKVDQQYAMFDVKGVDWQAVHDSLRPKVFDGMPSDSLFDICAAMLNTLSDGHVNLYSSMDVSHADSIYYDFYTHSSIDVNNVVLNYLGVNHHVTGGLSHNALLQGRVAYIRYSSFSSGFTLSQLRQVLKKYDRAEGLIIDIRGNGGGSLSNVYKFLQIMPSHGQLLYRSQIKSGPAHDDFSPLSETLAPQVPDSLAYQRPIVVLIDRGCFSASSLFAICTRAYPSVVLMGDTTSGGTGLPSMGVLPNGWRYRFPVTRALTPEGFNYENGVPPDVPLGFSREQVAAGRDNIIDSACNYIINQ